MLPPNVPVNGGRVTISTRRNATSNYAPKRAIVLLSGGLDSATALYWAKRKGFAVVALAAEVYGRPAAERRAARRLAKAARVRLLEVPLPFLKDAVHLADEGWPLRGNPRLPGFVPSRNLVLYGAAAFYAEALDADFLVGGHLQSDPHLFPDASRAFFKAFETLLQAARPTERRSPRILLPLGRMEKVQVIRLGRRLGVPFQHTWSCYADARRPCGECLSCLQRRNAFRLARLNDPAC